MTIKTTKTRGSKRRKPDPNADLRRLLKQLQVEVDTLGTRPMPDDLRGQLLQACRDFIDVFDPDRLSDVDPGDDADDEPEDVPAPARGEFKPAIVRRYHPLNEPPNPGTTVMQLSVLDLIRLNMQLDHFPFEASQFAAEETLRLYPNETVENQLKRARKLAKAYMSKLRTR